MGLVGFTSLDKNPSIMTVIFFIQLMFSTYMSSGTVLAVSVDADLAIHRIKAGESHVMTFASTTSDKGRQKLLLNLDRRGKYHIVLSNANPPYSGHWMIWDYLKLSSENTILWDIGDSEAPPIYSEVAFDEFCNGANCSSNFIIGKSFNSEFSKEINDNNTTEIRISFTLREKYARRDLALELSTLFATHDQIPDYKLRVTLLPDTEN